ncbi:hypothetical protein IRB23M11_15460 [Alkalibacterium sp. m-11]|jgi:hypothetical protein|uniref:Cytochrome c oxidase subunit 4 n=1 Tax=Alkalibacterium indicireducens TaxID=398758 RepID=A0ABN1BAF2_9LACT
MSQEFAYEWLNVASLFFGLLAWALPAYQIVRPIRRTYNQSLLVLSSFAFCTAALWLHLLYNNHLVQIQDWGALLDTSSVLTWVAGILLLVTIVLNIFSIRSYAQLRVKK